MSPAESTLYEAAARPALRREMLGGWGGARRVPMHVLQPAGIDQLQDALGRARGFPGPNGRATGVIARGMGRSYADAAQLADGLALRLTEMKDFRLEADTGVVRAQAGVTIGELLAALVPVGWMVPVVPGTQHVTIGGAVASDIHGKNHGVVGTFGRHVRRLGLLTSAGELLELGPEDDLFQATLGGMGLTGAIVWAEFALRAVSGPWLSVDTDRVEDLDGALAALTTSGGSHRVAWIDLLGPHPGRGIVTRAEHVEGEGEAGARRGRATVRARLTVPEWWPGSLLRPELVRAHNELRFRLAPRHERGHIESLGSHMFPLDGLDAWPRLYGRDGFYQYQLVVPQGAEPVLRQVIEHLRRARVPVYLAVLKDFGPANQAPLSFPIAGWTLALDLPCAAPGLRPALDRCDELVAAAGGRVYLTKDARLRPETVRAMYPRLGEWQAIRDRADPDGMWRSDLALRTGLVAA
jgi:decaprenylphospho-beta-D-ribofuranose 2-oxidase